MKRIYKQLLSVSLIICMLLMLTPVSFASSNIYVKIIENDISSGRLFDSSEAPGFTVVIQNKGVTGEVNITSTLKNLTLNSDVWTSTQNINIGEKKQLKIDVLPVYTAENGFGNLVLSVSGSLNGETFSVQTMEFTRVNGAESLVRGVGYNTYMNLSKKWRNAGIQEHIDTLNAGGFGIVRDWCEWAAIEVGNTGEYRMDEGYLNYLRSIKNNGGRIIWGLGYNNVNYGVAKSTIIPTAENGTLQPFLNYCEWVVKKLDGIVDDFEVWNEPDIAWFSDTQSAQEYYDLLKAVYPVIKNAREDKSANVVGMVTTSGAGSKLVSKDGPVTSNSSAKSFMRYVVELGGLEYMDKISFHHYPDNAFDISSNYNVKEIFDTVLDELGTYNKPLIISEIGYTTKYQTESQKASYMPKFIPLIKSIPSRNGWSDVNIDGICFYQLFDKKASSESDKNNHEFYFGSLKADMTAKPDFITTSFANKLIGNATDISLVNENKYGINKYSFVTDAGESGYAIWNNNSILYSNQTISFVNQSGYKTKVYDMYGNLESITDSNRVTVKTGADVKYIIYSNKSDTDVTATPPQKPTSYIYPEPVVENCEISVNNGTVTINGNANSEYVSIFATEFEKDIKESDVVEIVKVDNNSFSKTISLPSGKIYRISVSVGYTKENVFTSEIADGKIDLKVNGENITSVESLNSYGNIVANVSLDRTTMKNLMLIGAVYTGEQLETCDIGENGSLAVEIISDENETASIMFWEQDTLTPVFPKIDIKNRSKK